MKKIILLVFIIGIISSCNNDDDTNTNSEVAGSWILTKMSGSIPNSTVTGVDMEWQETYVLNTNLTFVKTRERDGVITEVSGTYTVLLPQDTGRILELTFTNDNNIIGNCSTDLVEHMDFQSEISFVSSWRACDGPGLTYEKVNL